MPSLSRTLLMTVGLLSMVMLSACAAAPVTVQQSAVPTRLAPCPDSPNCVSTQASRDDAQHFIEAITYAGSAADAQQRLRTIINAMPRTQIVTDEADAIHATFTSLVFRFVDDVQFVIDDATKTIHFRSASRVGHSDLGVNRTRMEEIRTRFTQAAVP